MNLHIVLRTDSVIRWISTEIHLALVHSRCDGEMSYSSRQFGAVDHHHHHPDGHAWKDEITTAQVGL